MVSICYYFQVHQPYRLRNYTVFDIGNNDNYFENPKNQDVMIRVANKCYLKANAIMLKLIKRHKGKFKVSYSISGMALEQMEEFAPEVLDSFKKLAETGCVEFIAETYNHSLAFLHSRQEFKDQVNRHVKKIEELFGQKPKVLRNTELIYNNDVAVTAEEMGFQGILAEGAERIVGWKSPNIVYRAAQTENMKVLLRNYQLSDDIGFRFSDKNWEHFPLTADKFAHWVSGKNGQGDVVNIFIDYETLGEHQWEDTGIFSFIDRVPGKLLRNPKNEFVTVSEAIQNHKAKEELDVPMFVSWADVERDLSAWTGNKLQQDAIQELYKLEKAVKESNNPKLIADWRKLTTSDHFYYMCIKWFNDGDVHKYFSPYETPYDAFISFMNVVKDIKHRVEYPKDREVEIDIVQTEH